jgi:hypothetical protein
MMLDRRFKSVAYVVGFTGLFLLLLMGALAALFVFG